MAALLLAVDFVLVLVADLYRAFNGGLQADIQRLVSVAEYICNANIHATPQIRHPQFVGRIGENRFIAIHADALRALSIAMCEWLEAPEAAICTMHKVAKDSEKWSSRHIGEVTQATHANLLLLTWLFKCFEMYIRCERAYTAYLDAVAMSDARRPGSMLRKSPSDRKLLRKCDEKVHAELESLRETLQHVASVLEYSEFASDGSVMTTLLHWLALRNDAAYIDGKRAPDKKWAFATFTVD